jgi:hypothetical protein
MWDVGSYVTYYIPVFVRQLLIAFFNLYTIHCNIQSFSSKKSTAIMAEEKTDVYDIPKMCTYDLGADLNGLCGDGGQCVPVALHETDLVCNELIKKC